MLLSPKELDKNTPNIGPKTVNLKRLMDLGFNVPPFLAIPTTSIEKLYKNSKLRQALADEIVEKLPHYSYAVRSSALIEDDEEQSFAGQFCTELNVVPGNLVEAIYKCIHESKVILKGDLSHFSLLIQAFIEPDCAGVTFTRAPLGGREMLIEYHRGRGEELVSGKVQPQKKSFYWHQDPHLDLPKLNESIEDFKLIERHFQHPQDIEWCIKEGQFYFLQTRPVTTINSDSYRDILYLDDVLPKNQDFFYEKNEISEIAPRPTPFTLSLLQKIYSQEGPVSKVYASMGIEYRETDFLRLVGNELYVDRQKELQSLLPSFGYWGKMDLVPHWVSLRGSFKTFKNLLRLSRLKNGQDPLFQCLKQALEANSLKESPGEILELFLKDYQVIFEVNLMASKALKTLERILKKENICFSQALSLPSSLLMVKDEQFKLNFSTQGLQGNSLEINDETVFIQSDAVCENELAKQWWLKLPTWKQNFLKPFLAQALFWQRAREMGRWLTVKNTSHLRQCLLKEARKTKIDSQLIYFSTLDDFLIGKWDKKALEERRKEYIKYSSFTLPQCLVSRLIQSNQSGSLGVSPGMAEGVLVDLASIESFSGKKILYTKVLSPNLTQYFDQIEGIISEQGGMLSHLAIVAREKGLPVVSQVNLTAQGLRMGDQISLDGAVGEVRPLRI